MNTNLTIKSWAEDDRPREKMIAKGRSALSDAELIAILLGSGTATKSAVTLAQEMLHNCKNDLTKFGKWGIADLKRFKGVGDAKAITLMAAIELGRRRRESDISIETKIGSSRQVYELIKHHFQDLFHEEFYVVFLNRMNKVIQVRRISVGGMTGTIADGKVIFKEALLLNACGLILAHNHPSGQLKASKQDIDLTKELYRFGKQIEIFILDHLIITDNGYLSLADDGMMNF